MELPQKFLVAVVIFYFVLELFATIAGWRMHRGLVDVNYRATRFYVKNLPNKTNAAQLLSETRRKLFVVIEHLRAHPADIPSSLQDGCGRIVSKHCHRLDINELDAHQHGTVAMNRNKGQEIHVCIRECPTCVALTSADKVFVVALHELAHSATRQYDPTEGGATKHSAEFKRYERYLLQLAHQLKLVDAGAVVGSQYCGMTIPSV